MPPKKAQANTSAKVTKPAAAKSKATSRSATTTKKAATKKAEPAKKATTTTIASKKATAPKKTAAKSKVEEKAAPKAAPKSKAAASKKRKATDDDDDDDDVSSVDEAPVKTKSAVSKKRKVEVEAKAPPAKKVKLPVKGAVINHAPTQKLDVFVFGEGTAGELGLGTDKIAVDVKRPRLNKLLKPYGVVQIAAGGMHVAAITHDNKVLTWGVNDAGALGRDTEWDGGLKDMDEVKSETSSDSGDDNGLNPKECTPAEVDWSQTQVAEGTKFVQVAAGDSCTFVLTDDGLVYGWGCFRSNEGPFGFTPDVAEARRPMLIPELKKIVAVSCGANHALALDSNGAVFAWGSGQQNQLGRRIIERSKASGLKPQQFGLPKGPAKGIKAIESGAYHSFAISKTGDVYGWGLNNFGETGIMDGAGQDDAVITKPQVVKSLKGQEITCIKGGGHHSLAINAAGDCLVFGRIDESQGGLSRSDYDDLSDEDVIRDHKGPRIMAVPHKVVAIKEPVAVVSTSSDNNIAITRDGKAYSWGFSANYQTGQGTTDDVEVATLMDNTAIRERKLNGAYCGGQYSILTAPAEE
ncbi:RCC1/BLIP-II [Polychaeton citri CBS 116435]|uniref:RCC1/BLIP-II n=1 Tax=Polychaeton citri CBS 116435 TaxID=1314669 RepID=A0A9P4QC98_9PEZI|nr:RCC1/BLIP-II [Polychaeton citri CBS 116435]